MIRPAAASRIAAGAARARLLNRLARDLAA